MKKLSIFLLLNLILTTMSYSQQEARLLRFPTTDGDKIVFSYAGQLYTVSKQGGTARQLTTGNGYAIFPRLSPMAMYPLQGSIWQYRSISNAC
jgi:tricorn protease